MAKRRTHAAKSQTAPQGQRKLKRKRGGGKQARDAELSPKEQRQLKRKQRRIRQEFTAYATKVMGGAVLIGGGLGLLAGSLKISVLAIAAILCLGMSYKYPHQALWCFFIYLPFSGTIIYTLGNNAALQLAKDGFYLPALVSLIQYCRSKKLPIIINKSLWAPLLILVGYCCLVLLLINGSQQLRPNGEQPLLMGILGLKVLVGYVPLLLCSYYLISNKARLVFLMRLTAILIILCCLLGFIQYVFLLTGICPPTQGEGVELFKASLESRCFVGGALLYSPSQGQIRLPGTFVAPWQWGWFLISAAFLAFTTAFNDPQPQWRLVGLLAMGSNFVMAVVSGQRIALASVPAATLLLLVLTGQVANLKRFIPIAVILSLVLGIAAVQNPDIVMERVESFQSRWAAAPPHAFITAQAQWAFKEQDGVLGSGLGRGTNSARMFGKTHLVETYYPKLIYEIGLLGAILFLVVVTVLTVQCFRAYRSVGDRLLRSYGASFWVFVLVISYNTYYYPLDVDPVAVYYWFFAGIILRLPIMDKAAQQQTPLVAVPNASSLGPSKAAPRRSVFIPSLRR